MGLPRAGNCGPLRPNPDAGGCVAAVCTCDGMPAPVGFDVRGVWVSSVVGAAGLGDGVPVLVAGAVGRCRDCCLASFAGSGLCQLLQRFYPLVLVIQSFHTENLLKIN